MKTKLYTTYLLGLMLIAASCKKEKAVNAVEPVNQIDNELMVTSVNRSYLPLTVKTIAGKPNVKGYLDGIGDQARFNGLWGVELTDNGDLYVAEVFNNKIRKVTPSGEVSTVKIPLRPDKTSLRNPIIIKIDKDGTKNILALEYTYNFKYKIWIVKPNGELVTPDPHTPDYFYYDLAKDPYNSYYWICGGKADFSNTQGGPKGILEKFLINNEGTIGTDTYSPPKDSLVQFYDQQYPSITGIFNGYNGVKYIIVNQKHIYKLTPSGVFTQIFRNFQFELIYSIVANKDSRTIYVADGGRICSISNGKLQYLVGPQPPYDGGDGVGSSADVRAHHMALSKDEGTLYFTDFAHYTVRKLLLR